MTEPLTSKEEAALRAYHHPVDTLDPAVQRCACDFEDDPVGDVEGRDQYVWPCSSVRLIATLDAERARLTAALADADQLLAPIWSSNEQSRENLRHLAAVAASERIRSELAK